MRIQLGLDSCWIRSIRSIITDERHLMLIKKKIIYQEARILIYMNGIKIYQERTKKKQKPQLKGKTLFNTPLS